MTDIHAGGDINVGRDFIVNEDKQEYKLLNQCTNDELRFERRHRFAVLREAKREKRARHVPVWGVAASFIFAAGVFYWIEGRMDMYSFLTGTAGFLVGLASMKSYDEPNQFEQRQILTLNEIHMLLRERGAA